MFGNDLLENPSARSRLATNVTPTSINPANLVTIAELLAKVEELLRQPTESRETILTVGPLQLDLLTRIVKRDERKIDLRPREFCLLEFMMRRKGHVLTRATLFKEIWNYKFVPQSNLVDVHMGRLRSKIDQAGESPMIFSIRGQGFVLRAPE
jgi:two-component system, OmpR family, response regulator